MRKHENTQTPQGIIKQAKQSGKSVKETKELLQNNKEIESANNQKIQVVKDKIKELKKETRVIVYRNPTSKYIGKGNTLTQDQKYLDYRKLLHMRDADFNKPERLKEDKTLKGKAKKEAMDTIYLCMYENMQQANKEVKERTRAFAQIIRERDLQEAKEWLEKNKEASSDYVFETSIKRLDEQIDKAYRQKAKG